MAEYFPASLCELTKSGLIADAGHISENQFSKTGSLVDQVNRVIADPGKLVQKQRNTERK